MSGHRGRGGWRRRTTGYATTAVVLLLATVAGDAGVRPAGGPPTVGGASAPQAAPAADTVPHGPVPTAGTHPDAGPPGLGATGGPHPDAAGRRTVRILAAGDVLVHPEVTAQARRDARRTNRPGGLDFAPIFAGVAPAVSGADLALCHLETPLAEPTGPFLGWPSFNAPPQVLDGLWATGFDGCSTASNHTLDQGTAGVTRTLRALDAVGLRHTGSARSAVEAATPTIYPVGDVRVAHLSYTLNFNGLRTPPGESWRANLIDPPRIRAAARRARAAGADIVVASLHWGTEYQHLPDADQRTWAAELIRSPDIDLILGHHAHVVQPFHRIGDKWVVYGMGNELARHARPVDANREGVMARVTFTEVAPRRWRIGAIEALPTWTELAPDIRLLDVAAALADDATPPGRRAVYRAAYDRVGRHVRALGRGVDPMVRPGG